MDYENKVKNTFSNKVAENWSDKSKYITKIYGEKYKFKNLIDLYCKDNIKILEVGCGNGKNLIYIDLKYRNCDITGIELSEDMLKCINHNFTNCKLKLYNEDIFNIIEINKYDLIIVKQVLHHIKDKENFIKKLGRLLDKDGKILLMFPNEEFFCNIYNFDETKIDPFGRISEKYLEKILKNSNVKINKLFKKKFEYEFKNIKNFLNYIYGIGTLQKITDYKFDNNLYELYMKLFSEILDKDLKIKVKIGYTYLILEKEL